MDKRKIIPFFLTLSLFAESELPPEVVQKIEIHVVTCSWPSIYYDVVPRLIRKHGFKNILEIGVALGGHAEAILKNTDIEMYYGVDPYKTFDCKDPFQDEVLGYSRESGQKNFDYLFSWVNDVRLQPFTGRYSLIREQFEQASLLFEDESLDCIFIDGDHHYENVMNDLKTWFPKVRKGGILFGDDYWQPDVARAVHDFFERQIIPVSFSIADSGYKIWTVEK